jgi:hypothetical protein
VRVERCQVYVCNNRLVERCSRRWRRWDRRAFGTWNHPPGNHRHPAGLGTADGRGQHAEAAGLGSVQLLMGICDSHRRGKPRLVAHMPRLCLRRLVQRSRCCEPRSPSNLEVCLSWSKHWHRRPRECTNPEAGGFRPARVGARCRHGRRRTFQCEHVSAGAKITYRGY